MHRGTISTLALTLLLTAACLGERGSSGEPGGGGGGAGGGGGGSDAGTPTPTCGEAGRSGETACETSPSGSCPSGQYCDGVMLTCTPGCTTDDNCGAHERCARAPGEAVGACEACPTCGDGVCQGSETASSCPADCGGGTGGGGGGGDCGDGVCQGSETAGSCPADCGGDSTPLELCIAACRRAGECGAPVGEVEACRASCGVATEAEQRAAGACNRSDCAVVASCFGLECLSSAQCAGAAACIEGSCCGNGTCGVLETWDACPSDCGDELVADCLDECDAYDFFECSSVGCASACVASSPPDRQAFIECANPTACNYDTCAHLL